MARITLRISALLLVFVAWSALAAPADDGQTAGARLWTLNQARSFKIITPSDSTDFTPAPSRFVLGWITAASTCNLAIIGVDDVAASVVIPVAVGQFHPMEIKRVLVTGTTCTTVVVGY